MFSAYRILNCWTWLDRYILEPLFVWSFYILGMLIAAFCCCLIALCFSLIPGSYVIICGALALAVLVFMAALLGTSVLGWNLTCSGTMDRKFAAEIVATMPEKFRQP